MLHIYELKFRFYYSILSILLVWIVVLLFKDYVLLKTFYNLNLSWIFTNINEGLLSYILVSLSWTLIILFPYIFFFHFYLFFRSACYARFDKIVLIFILKYFIIYLFLIYLFNSWLFAFLINYLAGFNLLNDSILIEFQPRLYDWVMFWFKSFSCFLFICSFSLLIIPFVYRFRYYWYFLILFLSSIITPPDIFTQWFIALPICFIVELDLLFIKIINKL